MHQIKKYHNRDATLGVSIILGLLCFLAFGCKPEPQLPPDEKEEPQEDTISLNTSFFTGMDMSYQPLLNKEGVVFKEESGEEIVDMYAYLQSSGVNLVRLRLFHTPDLNDPVMAASSLEEVLKIAEALSQIKMPWLLDIHYSDTWADPGHQTLPAAWQGLSVDLLEDSIYEYTLRVLTHFEQANVLPDLIQIGNETNDGFLWETGRAWGNFPQYAKLLKSAIAAVDGIAKANEVQIHRMIHLSGVLNRESFFDQLEAQNVPFDLIGLSHYSRWHTKDLKLLRQELNMLADRFEKPIILVETAYPWTLGWDDWTNNIVGGNDHLVTGFAATPEGQAAYLAEIVELLQKVPDGRGAGFVWWAPDYVAFDGPESTIGSPWENMTTFDFDYKALPVMQVFEDY
ncbi:MAG: glycosyl hydrolase 53 family protein [Bacteroidota bacterium]